MASRDGKSDLGYPWLKPQDYVALARAPRLAPEKQWWNLPAKLRRAEQIANQEKARASAEAAAALSDPRNTMFDAKRHARWSQRMTREIDPTTAALVGYGHEAQNLLEGAAQAGLHQARPWRYDSLDNPFPRMSQTFDEIQMDLHNNSAGRRAGREGRGIADRDLRTLPGPRSTY